MSAVPAAGSVATASSTYPANQMNTVAAGGPVVMSRNGYLYVWVISTMRPKDGMCSLIIFRCTISKGRCWRENHYYPFGLTLAGISDKALKTQYAENKYRYNGGNDLQNKEFSDGSGLEGYDATFRMYDPQIGRFWQIDPLADINENSSPYSFVANNPIKYNDPSGLDTNWRRHCRRP